MGAAENRKKSSAQAAYMKERGITRTTMQCPIGPSHSVAIKNLLNHPNVCPGPRRKKVDKWAPVPAARSRDTYVS